MKSFVCIIMSMVIVSVFFTRTTYGMQDFSSAVNSEESIFCCARAQLIGESPNIALCLSGGGFRAMIAACGFFKGAQKIGLLDRSMYVSALSGGTWMLANLLAREISPENFADFEHILRERVTTSYYNKEHVLQAFKQSKVAIPWREIELIDVYGICIAERLLGDKKYSDMQLSQLMPSPDKYPYPLLTAVCDPSKETGFWQWFIHWITKPNHYEWMELSPFWVEMVRSGKAIPTHFLGSVFDAGNIVKEYPEPPLSFVLGVCGSAFSLNFKDISSYIGTEIALDKSTETPDRLVPEVLSAFVESFEHGRICPPRIPNILYNDPKLSKYFHDDEMIIHDAGTDFNLPIPPLLKKARNIKVIVICDASDNASLETYPELYKAKKYADKHKLSFPSVDKPVAKNAYACVFSDYSASSVPVIVYVPLLLFQYSTFKFSYSTTEFENVVHYMEQAILNSRDLIQAAIGHQTKIFNNYTSCA